MELQAFKEKYTGVIRLNMGHSNGLKLKNMQGQWKPGQPLTDEDHELLKPILEAAQLLGHTPRVQDVPNADKIKKRFRIWKNALLAAGFLLWNAVSMARLLSAWMML